MCLRVSAIIAVVIAIIAFAINQSLVHHAHPRWEPELRGKAAVVPGDICRLSYDVPSDKRAFNVPVDKMKGAPVGNH